ncbi:transposase [Aldersonia kunmingensis]|uniref:transposase n=1 Tax=Aldersonia kunmingensis TaxID=408066 RepID=UPI000A6D90E6|nr:transposase [Aldersonia kunmingensis]
MLPSRTGKRGRPFGDARTIVEGIVYRYRYRCGIGWRDLPEVFGPWQTVWTWHRRMSGDGTWDRELTRLLSTADAAGQVEWRYRWTRPSPVHIGTPPTSRALRGLDRITRIRASRHLTTA